MKSQTSLTIEDADRILQARMIYQYDTEWNMAICTLCCSAVAGKSLRAHANRFHKISYRDYRPSLDALRTKSLPNGVADFPRPANGTPAIAGLKVHDGFECVICHYLTTSKDLIMNHINKHPIAAHSYCPVKLQVWINGYSSGLIVRLGVEIAAQAIGLSLCRPLCLPCLIFHQHLLHLPLDSRVRRIHRGKNNFWIRKLDVLLIYKQLHSNFMKATRRTILCLGLNSPSGRYRLKGRIWRYNSLFLYVLSLPRVSVPHDFCN